MRVQNTRNHPKYKNYMPVKNANIVIGIAFQSQYALTLN